MLIIRPCFSQSEPESNYEAGEFSIELPGYIPKKTMANGISRSSGINLSCLGQLRETPFIIGPFFNYIQNLYDGISLPPHSFVDPNSSSDTMSLVFENMIHTGIKTKFILLNELYAKFYIENELGIFRLNYSFYNKSDPSFPGTFYKKSLTLGGYLGCGIIGRFAKSGFWRWVGFTASGGYLLGGKIGYMNINTNQYEHSRVNFLEWRFGISIVTW